MNKKEILKKIKDVMDNGNNEVYDVFSFVDWLRNFIDDQLEEC